MMLKVYYTEDSMENHQSSKTLRQEKKYIFSLKDINKFEKNINKLGFKINHLPNVVNNIYFEDYKFTSAIENIEGNTLRSKYRIRWYNEEKKFQLEQKIKRSSSGYKKKKKLNSKNLGSAIEEVSIFLNKKPIIQNSYFRKYYLKNKMRITIDTNLKFNLPFTSNFKSFDKSIVEIKYDTQEIFDLSSIINNYTQLTKFSKYLEGLKTFNRI
jgi:hypothetical protein